MGPGEFAKADSAKISQRRIRKVKKGPKPDTNSDAPNPFVGVTLTAEAATGQPILEVPAGNQQNEGVSARVLNSFINILYPGVAIRLGHPGCGGSI